MRADEFRDLEHGGAGGTDCGLYRRGVAAKPDRNETAANTLDTQQSRIVRAIKRARYLGLLPYTINDTR